MLPEEKFREIFKENLRTNENVHKMNFSVVFIYLKFSNLFIEPHKYNNVTKKGRKKDMDIK